MPVQKIIASNELDESGHAATTDPEPARNHDLNVLNVVFGDRIIRPWYPSLYREEIIGGGIVSRLFVCDRCFKHTIEAVLYLAHVNQCKRTYEKPGRAVYSKGTYEIREVDGEEERLLTQNLSLFAKLFIENKSVCFDVHTFLYYLLILRPEASTEASINASQVVGFFSKEKLSWDNNNLACILVFPPWQKLGLGQMIMGASYELGRREGRMGGPERPLSALGRRSYLGYWSCMVVMAVLNLPADREISVQALSDLTYITSDDIVSALLHMEIPETCRKDGTLEVKKETCRRWLDAMQTRRSSRSKSSIEASGFLDVLDWWQLGGSRTDSEDDDEDDDAED